MTVISRAWIGLVLAMGANAAVAAGADPAPGPAPAAAPGAAAPSPPTGGSAADEELRNTVINILDALVQKGILTRDQAQALVADAQAKAAAAAKQKAEQQAATVEAEKNAVHVQYVPQVVRDQIEADVGSQVSKDVTQKVVQQAKTEGWGVPGALPDWIRNVRLYGDVRVRGEYDSYASGNAENSYLNYQAINTAGGIAKAGPNALLNTTESRPYLFGRLRFGALVHLGDSLSADFRVTSGSGVNPISENQNLGDYANRWAVGVDRAALLWNPHSKSWKEDVDVRFGRFENPFVTNSEFIWDVDVAFEGLSATWNWNRVRGWDERTSRWLFVTVGAFPM
ncbi:MAG TPA: putative porin, partial [Steroidobacteraceae bacterium]|nr:putative porin [Steroidobacteraceae bacterium]